jgi:hypothetical protein
MNIHLKNESLECKTDPNRGVGASGRGRKVNGEDEGGRIWFTYFAYLYENRAMKLVEIILSRGRG